jgi:hypothetical protein
MHHKKVISKNVTEKSPFSLFTNVRQTFFAYNFFWCIFYNFFDGFEISVKFCVFCIFSDFFPKSFFWVILALFANFEAERAKNGSKNQKPYFVNVS